VSDQQKGGRREERCKFLIPYGVKQKQERRPVLTANAAGKFDGAVAKIQSTVLKREYRYPNHNLPTREGGENLTKKTLFGKGVAT